jgi:hypothetical protein
VLDRHLIGIEVDCGRGPVEPAGLIKGHLEFRSPEDEIGRSKLAAQQWTERELNAQFLRARLVGIAAAAELDLLHRQGRGGKDLDVDPSGCLDLEPGLMADPIVDLGAPVSPIDEQRADQRRDERQNDHDCSSEQRRLHAVSILNDCQPGFPSPGSITPRLYSSHPTF